MERMTTAETYREQEARAADERHRPIIDALARGERQCDIAERFGVSQPWISQVAKRAIRRGLLKDDAPIEG